MLEYGNRGDKVQDRVKPEKKDPYRLICTLCAATEESPSDGHSRLKQGNLRGLSAEAHTTSESRIAGHRNKKTGTKNLTRKGLACKQIDLSTPGGTQVAEKKMGCLNPKGLG